jgi:hypothetical protein
MKQVACFVGWTFLAVALLLTRCPLALSQASQERGFRLSSSASKEIENGSYYALVIGINQYHQPLPILNTAVSDAQALTRILSERYGFQVQLLLDGNATRSKILNALSQYRRSLHENDNLLIYYAGHGHADSDSGKAYWLPADAESDTPSNWIIADELTTDIRVLPARHVLIISDSCYSGGLTRDTKLSVKPDDQQMFLRKMLASKSRTLMASGGNEPVADSGAGGHSVFANALLGALERVDTDAFTAGDLFHDFVLRQVAGRSDQIPRYSFIRDSDDDDGDFVFVRQGSSAKNGISSEKIVATPRSLGASISEFLGEWKSGALNSVFTVNRKECTAVPFIERTLHLGARPRIDV